MFASSSSFCFLLILIFERRVKCLSYRISGIRTVYIFPLHAHIHLHNDYFFFCLKTKTNNIKDVLKVVIITLVSVMGEEINSKISVIGQVH